MNQHETAAYATAPRTFMHTLLLCCGIIGSILFSVTYFTFGAITPDYDMMRQAISDLELIKHGWIQNANFIVFGLFICAFAAGLRKELVSGYGITWLPLMQVFMALGLILSGIFIYQPIHTPASVLSFVSLIISFFLFTRRFAGDPRWKGWAAYSIISAVLAMFFLAMFGYAKSNNGAYAGVFERLVVVTRAIWSVIFTIRLLDGKRLTPVE